MANRDASNVGPTKDHLSALPSELVHMICAYLYPTHEPNKAFEIGTFDLDKSRSTSQALDYLAATCKVLRANIMDWALHELTQRSDITKYKPLKTAKLQFGRNFLRGKSGLLTWAEKNCVFCGKKSSRAAILMNGLICCTACDKVQWPDKITKTDAKRAYDLKDHHLLPHEHHSPFAAKLLAKHPGGLPQPRYDTYMSSNVATTMFLRKDVEALAKLAHGDLRAHLAKRQSDRDERRRKAKAAKAVRDAEAAKLRDSEVLDEISQAEYYAGRSLCVTETFSIDDSNEPSSLVVDSSYLLDVNIFQDEGGFLEDMW